MHRLVSELPDARREANGGNGNFARADSERPRRVENSQRAKDVFVVGQRFAHAHENQIADAFAGNFLNLQNLIHNFGSSQVPADAIESAGAKPTAVGAADLRGNADGVPVTLAGETGCGRDENGFNQRVIPEFKQKFFGGVGGVAGVNRLHGVQLEVGGKFLPHRCR